MESISSLVAKRLKMHHLNKEAYASLVLEKTKQIITAHLGEVALNHFSLQKYRNGKVYIKAKSPSWKHEITAYKKVFCTLLQYEFPHDPITDIIVL